MVNRARRYRLLGPRPPKPAAVGDSVDLLLSVPKWAVVAISAMFSLLLLSAAALDVLPINSTLPSRILQLVSLLTPLIVLIGYGKLRIPVRIPKSLVLLFVLQSWLAVCTLVAYAQLARGTTGDETDYLFLLYSLVFMAGAIGCFYAPVVRKIACFLTVGFASLNAIVGVLQFVKFGPALRIAATNNPSRDITNWDGVAGAVRLIGLTDYPENLAIICLMANGVFLGRLLVRRLNPLEYFASAVFIGVAFAAQSRVMYLAVGITVVVEFALVVWHDRKFGSIMFGVCAALLALVYLKAGDRLAYGLRLNTDDPSFVYRREIAWPQAYNILDHRPATGIGIDRRLATTALSRSVGDIDRWAAGVSVDNGFLLMASWGGYPALGIYSLTWLCLIVGMVQICADRKAPPARRIIAAVALSGALAVLNNSFLNNSVLQWRNLFWIALCGGMAMPAADEVRSDLNHLRNRFRRADGETLLIENAP